MMRSKTEKYYEGWIICEDPGCTGRTRQIPLKVSAREDPGFTGRIRQLTLKVIASENHPI